MKMKLMTVAFATLMASGALAEDRCAFGALQTDGTYARLTAEAVYEVGSRPAACVDQTTAQGIMSDINTYGKLAPGATAKVTVMDVGKYAVIVESKG